MIILEDTRQQIGKHITKNNCFNEMGIRVERCTLPYGDYILPPSISVDTKRDIEEIYGNLVSDHERFRGECIFAKDAGCHLYILIENEEGINEVEDLANWHHKLEWSFRKNHKRFRTGKDLVKIMNTMHEKYGVTFMFCHPSVAAELTLRILNGEFEDDG